MPEQVRLLDCYWAMSSTCMHWSSKFKPLSMIYFEVQSCFTFSTSMEHNIFQTNVKRILSHVWLAGSASSELLDSKLGLVKAWRSEMTPRFYSICKTSFLATEQCCRQSLWLFASETILHSSTRLDAYNTTRSHSLFSLQCMWPYTERASRPSPRGATLQYNSLRKGPQSKVAFTGGTQSKTHYWNDQLLTRSYLPTLC